jgi:hypothetical protein
MAQNVFTMLDADGDGMISRSEFDGGLFGTGAPVAPSSAGHCACGDEDEGVAGEDASSSDQTAGISTAEGGETSSQDAVATSDITAADEPNLDVAQGGDASTDGSIGTPAQNSVTTTEATNADGSTSTTITYPDGTKVTLTTPPNSGADGSSGLGPDHSPIESVLAMLIRLQAQMTEKVAA